MIWERSLMGPLMLGGIASIVGGIQGLGTAKSIQNNADTVSRNIANAGTTAGQNTQNATNTGQEAIQTALLGAGDTTQQGQQGIQNAVQQGQAGVTGATGTSNSTAEQLLGSQLQGLSPYQQTGTQAESNLQNLAANPFHAPTAAEAEATPGYQFQQQQGLQELQQQLAQSGGAGTGGALKALTQYGQGVASTYYQNAFNNALSAYNTNVNTNEGLASQGLQAGQMANQATQNYGNIFNQNTMGSAMYNSNLGAQGALQSAQIGQQGSAQQLQGASNFGQLGLQGTLAAGNQQIGTEEYGGNLLMQGTEAAGQAKAGAWGNIASGAGGASQAFSNGSYNPSGGFLSALGGFFG